MQALDHGTGYLIAAAALRGLTVRTLEGRPLQARLALARTAGLLLAQPRPAGGGTEVDPGPFRVELHSPLGTVSTIAPPGQLDGRALGWDRGPVALGADEPRWW